MGQIQRVTDHGYTVHEYDGLRVEYWPGADALRFIDPKTSERVVDMPMASFCELALKTLDRSFETTAMIRSLKARGYDVTKAKRSEWRALLGL